MNYKMMGRFIGKILIVEAVFMVPAMLISLWERVCRGAGLYVDAGGNFCGSGTIDVGLQGIQK